MNWVRHADASGGPARLRRTRHQSLLARTCSAPSMWHQPRRLGHAGLGAGARWQQKFSDIDGRRWPADSAFSGLDSAQCGQLRSPQRARAWANRQSMRLRPPHSPLGRPRFLTRSPSPWSRITCWTATISECIVGGKRVSAQVASCHSRAAASRWQGRDDTFPTDRDRISTSRCAGRCDHAGRVLRQARVRRQVLRRISPRGRLPLDAGRCCWTGGADRMTRLCAGERQRCSADASAGIPRGRQENLPADQQLRPLPSRSAVSGHIAATRPWTLKDYWSQVNLRVFIITAERTARQIRRTAGAHHGRTPAAVRQLLQAGSLEYGRSQCKGEHHSAEADRSAGPGRQTAGERATLQPPLTDFRCSAATFCVVQRSTGTRSTVYTLPQRVLEGIDSAEGGDAFAQRKSTFVGRTQRRHAARLIKEDQRSGRAGWGTVAAAGWKR